MTQKRRKFCREYLKCGHITNSAIRAGYSARSAYSQGSRLLKNAEIKEYLKKLASKLLEKEKENLEYELIHKLKAIAFADVTDDVKIETYEYSVPVYNKKGKDTGKTEVKQSQRVVVKDTDQFKHGYAVASIEQKKDGIKVTYANQNNAIEQLNRIGGFFNDKVDHTIRDGNPEGNKNGVSGFVPFKGADVSEK